MLNPQLFSAKSIFVQISRKWVVVLGTAPADPSMSQRQIFQRRCLAGVHALRRCVPFVVITSAVFFHGKYRGRNFEYRPSLQPSQPMNCF